MPAKRFLPTAAATMIRSACSRHCGVLFVFLILVCHCEAEDLLIIRDGDLPILITAPHGGRLELPDVPVRTGDGLKKGPAGFFAGRDTGTEELALRVVELLDQRVCIANTSTSTGHRKLPSNIRKLGKSMILSIMRPAAASIAYELRTREVY
jgi:hypothetical protein